MEEFTDSLTLSFYRIPGQEKMKSEPKPDHVGFFTYFLNSFFGMEVVATNDSLCGSK